MGSIAPFNINVKYLWWGIKNDFKYDYLQMKSRSPRTTPHPKRNGLISRSDELPVLKRLFWDYPLRDYQTTFLAGPEAALVRELTDTESESIVLRVAPPDRHHHGVEEPVVVVRHKECVDSWLGVNPFPVSPCELHLLILREME